MSADPENEYFSGGIAGELINALTRFPGLKVIARTSAFSFKRKNVDVREIGRTLGVRTVLEGSVRKAGSRLRVTAQLVDATDGSHRWSERYDRELEDVFAIQDEITGAIRDAIGIQLLGQTPPARQRTDPDTYALYLKGRFCLARMATRSREEVELLQQAIGRDPGFAPSYAALGTAYMGQIYYATMNPAEALAKGKAAADRALAADPDLPEAHILRARVEFTSLGGGLDPGLAVHRLADRHGGNSAEIRELRAWSYAAQGLFDLAVHRPQIRNPLPEDRNPAAPARGSVPPAAPLVGAYRTQARHGAGPLPRRPPLREHQPRP